MLHFVERLWIADYGIIRVISKGFIDDYQGDMKGLVDAVMQLLLISIYVIAELFIFSVLLGDLWY